MASVAAASASAVGSSGSGGGQTPSLRDKQIEALSKMLYLNDAGRSDDGDDFTDSTGKSTSSNTSPVWKVLVFDARGRDIISTVMKINHLRERGVTLHMLLGADRQPLTDVPAVYFMRPTVDNIQRVCTDLQRELYDLYYLNFVSSIPRPILEDLAAGAAQANAAHQVAQVYDQYLDFICPEPNVFTLELGQTFQVLNSPATQESAIEGHVSQIVDLLFSVLATYGVVPVIRAARGNAAEMVAQQLDSKLRDNLMNSRHSLFADSAASGFNSPAMGTSGPPSRPYTPRAGQQQQQQQQQQQGFMGAQRPSRPVLIILDRAFDLAPMVAHAWTYQALVHDILDMNLNKVTVMSTPDQPKAGSPPPAQASAAKKVKKEYDLDVSDTFWAANAHMQFQQVAENVSEALDKYTKEANDLTRKSGVSSIDDLSGPASNLAADMSSSTKQLKAAMSLLPELTQRKAMIDMHMNVTMAVLGGINDRQLHVLYQTEEAIGRQNKSTILELINDPEKKNPEDKLRLFLVYYLAASASKRPVSRADLVEFESALRRAGCEDLSALDYVKHLSELSKMTGGLGALSVDQSAGGTASGFGAGGDNSSSGSGDIFGRFGAVGSRFAEQLRSSGATSSIGNLFSGMRNLLPANTNLPITRIVEAIMDAAGSGSGAASSAFSMGSSTASAAQETAERFAWFDPKQTQRRGPGASGPVDVAAMYARHVFQDAIVFVVGGGNYIEHLNLEEYAQRSNPPKNIVYGSTEILNAKSFLEQLSALGQSGRPQTASSS
ncbi:Sec1-like protein [Ramicandelaber brevisporus]|nr:Sec1-like protein [Ramicandelaber brevisporus]